MVKSKINVKASISLFYKEYNPFFDHVNKGLDFKQAYEQEMLNTNKYWKQ